MKRLLMISALTLLGTVLAVDSAYADRPRLHGTMVFIYPDGTVGYFAGSGGYRSDYYVIPSVSSGAIGPVYNDNSGYNGTSGMNDYNPASRYVDYRWRRAPYRAYSDGWNR